MIFENTNILKEDNLQKGWEAINEYLFFNDMHITTRGGGFNGNEWISYDNIVIMENAHIDPEFDFGRVLGYSIRKWTTLVKNYVDMNYLEMLRADIALRHKKHTKSYNHTYHFTNQYGNGKDCLISLTFSKRIQDKKPIITFHIRTSEVTKRLIWDFLLVQRICEMIYGHTEVEVHLLAPAYFITVESFTMYHNHRDMNELFSHKKKKWTPFQDKVYKKFKEYIDHPEPHTIKYRVHRRAAEAIQKGPDGLPLNGVKSLKAKDIFL